MLPRGVWVNHMKKVWWVLVTLIVLSYIGHYFSDQGAIEQCLEAGGFYHYDQHYCSKTEAYTGSTNYIANHIGFIILLGLSVTFAIGAYFVKAPKSLVGKHKRLLMIDNYDSFTYNLVQYFADMGLDVLVRRNDELTIKEAREINPDYIVISPGPATPNESGISLLIIEELAHQYPILGVCLGHQVMAQAFGGKIVRAKQVMHGKTSEIHHTGKGVFKDLPSPIEATRYHSLVVDNNSLPEEFEVTAWTEDEDGDIEYIMGIKHRTLKLEGVQFHPESIMSQHGHQLLRNFILENVS